jgi:hypothetical protein
VKPALRVLVTAVVALALGAWLFGTWRRATHQAEARLARERAKREFLERSVVARQLPADREREWRDEVRGLARWYASELAGIRDRWPGAAASGGDGSRERDRDVEGTRAEWRRYAEERFRLLAEGRYEPLAAAADRGLHLDLLAIEPGPNPSGGGRALRVDFALWGAPRRTERDVAPGGGKATLRTVVPVAFQQISFQFLDAQGKLYGEMTGPGEPYQKLAEPERLVEDFPPGVLFGSWWVEAFPREAVRAVVTLSTAARGQAGAEVLSTFRLDLPVAEAWRIAAGETYRAETREAPP